MLTYNEKPTPKRKDRPWLLVVLALIWVSGTAFFHSPWEPYEPFVLAVVKGILRNNSWLVPYVARVPYLEIQPFYFWVFAAILKISHVSNIYSIANSVRLINTVIIVAVIALSAKIGSNLSAFKNGRTVVLVLISSIGFINLSYQLSPDIIVILGLCLYLYALQLHRELPGISGWILFTGLFLVSITFSCEFILIALITLLILPILDKHWRNISYLITCLIAVIMFAVIFYLYCYELQQVDKMFFWQWKVRYMGLINPHSNGIVASFKDTVIFLAWYLVPGGGLVLWTLYKRRLAIFRDKIIQVNIVLAILLFLYTIFCGRDVTATVFPIILPVVFIAAIEIDSIRISIVSLFNWFSIFIFGVIGLTIWFGYICFNLGAPQNMISPVIRLTQGFQYHFSSWQVLLATLITFIWLFMITRRQIRGREMVSNWASGTTFVVILFMALWLPWFDAILTFKPLVTNSLDHIKKDTCTITNGADAIQSALWYYYADINLVPGFTPLDFNVCNQAVVAAEDEKIIDQKLWQITWRAKRPVDKKEYFVLKHR